MNPGALRAVLAAVAVGVILLGLANVSGVVSLSVTPVASSVPRLSVALTSNATSNALGVELSMHIAALPKGSMNVTSVSVTWGDTSSSVFHPHSPITGYFTMSRSHNYSASGSYQVGATVYGKVGNGSTAKTYTASAVPITVTEPFPGSGGCTSSCPSVQSSFSWSANGLTVTFTDASTAANATVTSISWSTGDGYCTLSAAGPCSNAKSFTHTYAAAGSYTVTEYVVAAPTGAGAPVNATSSENVTVTASGPGSGGTGGSASSVPLTPTSGLLLGSGIGMLAAVAIWRPFEGVLAVLAGAGLGFLFGMVVTVGL